MSFAENGLPRVTDLTKQDLALLPPRPQNGHKGTFGRVLIVGGSLCMSGAGYLAARAALRAGCGLCEIFCPWENRVIYQTQLPEALLTCYTQEEPAKPLPTALDRADAVAFGMGLAQGEVTKKLLFSVLTGCVKPLVIDADGLNVLAAEKPLFDFVRRYPAPVVLTPHMGEMSRLTGIAIAELKSDPLTHAAALAEKTGAVVVLKSDRTIVTDGKSAARNVFGNSGMATAGSGDVLAGITAAFLARGMNACDAARCAVSAHALAGDAAKEKRGENGMIASDIIDGLCAVLP